MEHPNLWDQNLFKDVLKIGGLKFGKTQKLKEKRDTVTRTRHPSRNPLSHHSPLTHPLSLSLSHTLTPIQNLPRL